MGRRQIACRQLLTLDLVQAERKKQQEALYYWLVWRTTTIHDAAAQLVLVDIFKPQRSEMQM